MSPRSGARAAQRLFLDRALEAVDADDDDDDDDDNDDDDTLDGNKDKIDEPIAAVTPAPVAAPTPAPPGSIMTPVPSAWPAGCGTASSAGCATSTSANSSCTSTMIRTPAAIEPRKLERMLEELERVQWTPSTSTAVMSPALVQMLDVSGCNAFPRTPVIGALATQDSAATSTPAPSRGAAVLAQERSTTRNRAAAGSRFVVNV